MPLANFKEILLDAKKNKYAVPCLVALNVEMALGQIMAAEEKKSPIIVAFAPHVMSAIPISLYIPLIINAAERASVPVVIELDHGFHYDEILSCIKSGVSAVMFDGSDLDYEENITRTSEIVKIAHTLNVCVEAELGFVGGSLSDDPGKTSEMTDPNKVVDFVAKTNVDALAVSFGNLHGKYRGEPILDLDRLRKISTITDVPLVMHGGSGLTAKDYKNVVANGMSDVHFYSYLSDGVWPEFERKTKEIGRSPKYHEIMSWTIEYYFNETKKVIDMLDSSNKASTTCQNSIYFDIIKTFQKQNTNQIDSENLNSMIREIINEVLKNVEIRR
ncbi:MAG: class II fructose-bisphosphate aldolase [Ruminiclostridium sp.]